MHLLCYENVALVLHMFVAEFVRWKWKGGTS